MKEDEIMKRYEMITTYTDAAYKIETTDNFILVLGAAAIYMEDPDCHEITVMDFETSTTPLHWVRD